MQLYALGNPPDRKLRVIHLGVCTDTRFTVATPWFPAACTMLPRKMNYPLVMTNIAIENHHF